jgi:tetratricopeptide (TPR) repeat protein
MRNFTKFLAIGSLVLAIGACKDDTDPNAPGGAGGAAANPDVPTAEAKAEFAKAVAAYEKANSDGNISGDECGRVAGAFDKVYNHNKKSMRIARFNAGVVWERCGKNEEAKKIYEELAATNYHLAFNNLGVMYWNQGNTKKALDMFDKSVKADKVKAFAARNNLAAAHRDRYSEKASIEDFNVAEKQIQNVLAVDTSNKAAFENLARLYYDRGRLKDASYLVLANLVVQQALRVLKAEGEESADIYNLKGLLLMQDNNQVDALKAFKKAVEVDPKNVDANLNIAFISIRFRDYPTSEGALDVALKDKAVKRDIEALIAMGVTKRGLKKFKEAEKYYNDAAKLDAKDPRPFYNLGILNHEHLIGQDGVEKEQIEAFYNVAKKHFAKVVAVGASNKAYAHEVKDSKDRMIIIDDAIATFRIMEELERKAAEIAKKEAADAKKEMERLLELERKAAEAEAAAAAAPKEEKKEEGEKKEEKKEEKKDK